MQQFSGYAEAKENAKFSGNAKLPKGAYVCKILGVKETPRDEDKSGYLTVQFDIAEGEYKDFYQTQYKENTREDKIYKGKTTVYIPKDDGSEKDGWTKNSFAKWTNALEESNEGYTWDWDERKWKDKKIGLVFGETGTRLNNKDIVYTEVRYPVATKDVPNVKVDSIKFKTKNHYGENAPDDFMSIPDGIDEELPFA